MSLQLLFHAWLKSNLDPILRNVQLAFTKTIYDVKTGAILSYFKEVMSEYVTDILSKKLLNSVTINVLMNI